MYDNIYQLRHSARSVFLHFKRFIYLLESINFKLHASLPPKITKQLLSVNLVIIHCFSAVQFAL